MSAPKGNKNAKGNKGGGRKTDYKVAFEKLATEMTLLGATDKELATAMGVSEVTINNWKKENIKFSLALKAGKILADAKVANSLYEKALSGDTTAMIYWLKNRRKEHWRDKTEVESKTDHTHTIFIERETKKDED